MMYDDKLTTTIFFQGVKGPLKARHKGFLVIETGKAELADALWAFKNAWDVFCRGSSPAFRT